MKQFPFVPKKLVTLLNGDNPDGATDENPKYISHHEFLVSRLSDPSFVGGKEGMDALVLVATTRIELDNQKGLAEERGFWLFEDDRAEALFRSTKKPEILYNFNIAHILVEFAKATLDQKNHE